MASTKVTANMTAANFHRSGHGRWSGSFQLIGSESYLPTQYGSIRPSGIITSSSPPWICVLGMLSFLGRCEYRFNRPSARRFAVVFDVDHI